MIELSLTVPITNSLAFLFTVLGEWWVEGKVISRGVFSPPPPLHSSLSSWYGSLADSNAVPLKNIDTWIGMAFVLGGIALCVQSKNV